MKTNEEVVRAWYHGREAQGLNIHTDGRDLYSYRLLIGSGCIVLDYTSPDNYVSQTTSCHVGLARRMANTTATPLSDVHK